MYSARVTHVNTQCANRAVSWEFDGTRIRFLELGDFLITVGGPQGVWKSFFQDENRMELCHVLLQAFNAAGCLPGFQDHRSRLNLG